MFPGVGAPLAGRLRGPHTQTSGRGPVSPPSRTGPGLRRLHRARRPLGPRPPQTLTRRSPVARVPAPTSRGLATLTGPRARSAAQAPAALAVVPGGSAPSPQPNRERSPARPTPLSLRPGRTAAFSPRPPTATALLVRPAPLRPAPLGPAVGRRARARTARGDAHAVLCRGRDLVGADPENSLESVCLGASPPLPAVLPHASRCAPSPGRLPDLAFREGIPELLCHCGGRWHRGALVTRAPRSPARSSHSQELGQLQVVGGNGHHLTCPSPVTR